MDTFSLVKRVQLTTPDPEHEKLRGWYGAVARRRISDNGAWVNMDDALPPELASFPVDDSAGRSKHVLLYPDECAEVKDGRN